MQVIKYEAHNVLGVKDIKFDLAGRHLFLVGGANGQGKSSALTALIMALAGKSGMTDYPEIALRKGQKKGKVTIELTGDADLMESKSITVELSLRQKASGAVVEEFRVLDSAGEEAPEPRKLLQRLFTLRAFDPLAFERMKPKEKATLVQEMLGLDLSKFDKEYQKVFADRTDLGRDGKKLAAQLEAAPKHKDAPAEEVKVSVVLEQIDEISAAQAARDKQDRVVEDAEKTISLWESATDDAVDEIARLEIDLQKAKEKLKVCKTETEGAKKSFEAQVKFLEQLPDRSPELAPLRAQIATAEDTNRKVRENAAYERLEAEVKQSRGDYQRLTDRLKEIQEERAEAVAKAEWPIKGMELNEDGLLMNGLPFEQASTSQRIMASVAVGMALNPKLRLLVCQHGSDLDNDTLDALDKVVKAGDFQCLIELVTRSKEDEERCAVVIADGEVVGATKAPDMDESSDTDEDEQQE
jgi:DNA repair exonuclease SbcCD ATPase subunit